MRNPTDIFLRCLVLIFGVVMLQATAHAQEARPATVAEEKKNPNAWEVRAYRYPAPPLMVGFDVIERGKLIAPPMSGRHASPEEIVAFLGRSHEVVSQHFRLESVLLPKGSLAAYDPDHQTLVIRTTNAVHNRIDALATSYMAVLPQYLAFSIRILEADGKVIRELVKECATKPVHLPALARLESLVAQGQAKHLGTLRVDTRSGQRATVKSVTDFHYLAEQTVDGRDLAATTQESREVGTIFQIDPIIAPDGLTIDSTIAVEHHHASPTMHWVASGQRGARAIESPTPDFHVAKVNTAITMLSGVTKLLGVWKPHNPAAEPPLDRLQIAFVKGDVVSIMPAPDNRLEGLVSAYGEKVEPTPKEPVPETTDTPPGMIRRSFRTPPSFLSVGMAPPVPSDPIGFPSPAWRDPRPTALEVLKAQGITFPPGAYANFNPSTCEMVVCNTPDNIALVEAYMSALMQTNVRVVVTTVDVVQADGATLRKVESETANTSDHALAWGMLEKEITAGRATVLSSAWLETRSGQRAICEAVTEHLFSQGAEYARIPGGDGERDKTASVNNVTISTGGSLPLATQFDMKKVGMELELDPVIGPDGITVDLNLSFKYDHAPPTTRQDPLVADDKVFRFRPAGLEFHQADISTAVTLHSGQRRLLGIWRPTGTPEFEKADVLQAAFLRVDVVEMQYDDEKKP